MAGIIKTGAFCYLADAHGGFSKQIYSSPHPCVSEVIPTALPCDSVKTGGEAPAGHHSGSADLVKRQISVEIVTHKGQCFFNADGAVMGSM